MFVLSDPTVVQALVAARRRGVKVQVILNRAPHGSNEKNEFARAELLRAGVEVAHGNPGFSVTHEKSMVVDDAIAFVKSFNWATKNFRATRDYAVITSHKREVREIADCFDADWHRQRFRPGEPSGLIWCPGGRDRPRRREAPAGRGPPRLEALTPDRPFGRMDPRGLGGSRPGGEGTSRRRRRSGRETKETGLDE